MIQFVQRVIWFVGLVLLQVLVLNHIHIYEYATPLLYIYFILNLDVNVSRKSLLCWAFFLGLTIDLFCNTPGMNAAAATFLAFVRHPILSIQTVRDIPEEATPDMRQIGFLPYVRYVLTCTLLYVFILHFIDTFSLFSWKLFMLKVFSDTIMTVVFILCVNYIAGKK